MTYCFCVTFNDERDEARIVDAKSKDDAWRKLVILLAEEQYQSGWHEEDNELTGVEFQHIGPSQKGAV